MSSNTYPRYGCSFCRSVDATKELHKVHLDKHLPDVCRIKGTALLPPGAHFLPLLCAVRRRSVRKGLNKTIALPTSPYDVCRDWRLFDVIKSDEDLAAFFDRDLRTRAQWEKLATEFVEKIAEQDEEPVSDRSTWDNYVPRWPVDKDDDEDGEDGDDDVPPRASRAHGNGNKNIQTTAQVQSAFGSPVKAKNGKFHVNVGGNKKSNTVRTLFDNGGEGSSRDGARQSRDKGKGKEKERRTDDSAGQGPSKKVKASEAEKARRNAKPLPEVVDLTTPVKEMPAVAYDIWTPPKVEPTMTVTVKGVGIFEVVAVMTLDEFVNQIQGRVGGTVVALKLKNGRPVDETVWAAREGASLKVAVEWDWSESE